MRRYIFLLCIFFTPVFGFAQNILRGKVIDAKTGEAIQGATIKLVNNFYLSDGKGEFSIEFHSTNKPRLVINHIAYKQQTVTIDSFRYVVIKMEQFESSLSEVVVSKQADDIITKAIKNIPRNYPQESYIQDFAHIMRHKMEEKERNAFFYGKINSVIRASYTVY